jgi:hypothetical protein
MEEAPENGKESSHSAHANGIEWNNIIILTIMLQLPSVFSTVICCTGL